MQLTLTAEKSALLKPAELKMIATAICEHTPFKGNVNAFVAWAALPKMRLLNRTWRNKDKPTNVLSYPQYELDELKVVIKKQNPRASLHVGDIVLCLPYIKNEAKAGKKPLNNHLTHLVVHGVLHLLGYDHIKSRDFKVMEKLEKAILADLNIPDPYLLPVPEKKTAKKRS